MLQNFQKIAKKSDDDMLPYLKRSIQATFVIIVIFYMTLLMYYRQRDINGQVNLTPFFFLNDKVERVATIPSILLFSLVFLCFVCESVSQSHRKYLSSMKVEVPKN